MGIQSCLPSFFERLKAFQARSGTDLRIVMNHFIRLFLFLPFFRENGILFLSGKMEIADRRICGIVLEAFGPRKYVEIDT